MTAAPGLRIAFLHLHLGIGGAERLTLAAARHLHERGHRVTIFTTRFDPEHALEDAHGLDIRTRAAWLPAHIAGGARAVCSIVRMSALVAAAAGGGPYDLVFCDLVAHIVPLLERRVAAPVIFYCHFPDQALAPTRGWLARLYRWPIDRLERIGMRRADRVLVNSRFTEAAVRRMFGDGLPLQLLYPAVPPSAFDIAAGPEAEAAPMILSIGRFSPEKNLTLAVDALQHLRALLPPALARSVRLVIAGGYAAADAGNRDAMSAVVARIAQWRLGDVVTLATSASDEERRALLARCRCVVHTAPDEHFGFAPIEAMAAGKPVVAIASGGPLETVVNGETGFLCDPTPSAFASALARLIVDPDEATQMGHRGRERAATLFSLDRFGRELDAIVASLAKR